MSLLILGILAASLAVGYFTLFELKNTLSTSITPYGSAWSSAVGWVVPNAGVATTSYQKSTDGETWSAGTFPSSATWRGAGTNGSRVVVLSTGTSALYSDNGTTWTAVSKTSGSTTQVIWDGTRFISTQTVGGTSGGILTSTDGTSWNSLSNINSRQSIAYDGSGRYIATRTASNAAVSTCTTDPTVSGNWSDVTMPSTSVWASIVYGSGRWVAFIDGSSTYAHSTNGTTWTTASLGGGGTNFGSQGQAKATFANGKFYYGSKSSQLGLFSSINGTTWTAQEIVSSSNLYRVTTWSTDGGKLLGFGTVGSTSNNSGNEYYKVY